MPIDHWMTFGTFAEQRYFTYPDPNTYKGVIINANMLAHAPSGLAAFMLEKTRPDFPYLIDPLTHAFQHDVSVITNSKGEVKSSVINLAKEYGSVIEEFVGKKPLSPADFNSEEEINEFVKKCLKFQEEKLSNAILDSDAFKYLEEFDERENLPYALVAPYFFMDELSLEEWLPIQIKCAKAAIELKKDQEVKIFSSIVINQGILLDDELLEMIIMEFSSVSLDGFLFWVDELDETNSNRAILKGFLKLSQSLRMDGSREVINLHGGYFSVLAASGKFGKSAFSGVAHGPEFGEFRKIVPVGGGIPVAKFYISQLHTRVNYRNAARYYNEKGWLESANSYYLNICDCQECRDVIKDDPNNFTTYGISETKQVRRGMSMVSMEYSIKETKEHCLKHYLNKKTEEFEFAENELREDILEDLKQGEDSFKDIASRETTLHLRVWHNVLSNQ